MLPVKLDPSVADEAITRVRNLALKKGDPILVEAPGETMLEGRRTHRGVVRSTPAPDYLVFYSVEARSYLSFPMTQFIGCGGRIWKRPHVAA